MGSSGRLCTEVLAVSPSPDRLPNPRVLQKLAVPIIDTPRCNLLYSKDAESGFQPKAIKDDMLCAGFAEGKKDACKVGARALLPWPPWRWEPAWPGPGGPRRRAVVHTRAWHFSSWEADSQAPPSTVVQFSKVCSGARNLQEPLVGESGQAVWGC